MNLVAADVTTLRGSTGVGVGIDVGEGTAVSAAATVAGDEVVRGAVVAVGEVVTGVELFVLGVVVPLTERQLAAVVTTKRTTRKTRGLTSSLPKYSLNHHLPRIDSQPFTLTETLLCSNKASESPDRSAL